MKPFISSLLVFILFIMMAGCSRDLGMGPKGSFLELCISFPDISNVSSSRLVHAESNELNLSLTYPDGKVISVQFDREGSESNLVVLVEDLYPAEGVVLTASLGMKDPALVLSQKTQTIDIDEGRNVPLALILEPMEYTCHVVLRDSLEGLVKNSPVYMGEDTSFSVEQSFQTDDYGAFSFTISTADIGEYRFFRYLDTPFDGDYYLGRTVYSLIKENGKNITFYGGRDFIVDVTIYELYDLGNSTFINPLSGIKLEIDTYPSSGEYYSLGTTDENGRLFYNSADYGVFDLSQSDYQLSAIKPDDSRAPYQPFSPGMYINAHFGPLPLDVTGMAE